MKFGFLFFLVVWCLTLSAQSPLLETISIDQGLSQGFVPSICQDDEGFLWFATKNGLNRYDGYHFKVFKNDPFDSLSLNNNEVVQVAAAGDFIIVFTRDINLMLFHRKNQKFYRLRNPLSEKNEIPLGFTRAGNQAVLSYAFSKGLFITYHIHWPDNLSDILLSNPEIRSIQHLLTIDLLYQIPDWTGSGLSPDGNQYWLYSERSLMVRNLKSGAERRIPPPFSLETTIPFARCVIIPDSSGKAWVYFNNQMARWDGHQWEKFRLSGNSNGVVHFDHKAGLLWASNDKQVYAYDLRSRPFRTEPVWNFNIGRAVRSCFTDQTGIVWFGTDALGVVKFNPVSGVFKTYVDGLSVYCQPVFNGRNHILLSDVRRGAASQVMVNMKTGETQSLAKAEIGHLPYFNIPATANGNFLWVSWDVPGNHAVLVKYNPESGSAETISLPDRFNISFAALKFVEPDYLWIVTTQKLAEYNLSTRRFNIFEYNNEPPAEIYAVEHTNNGIWWIGTMEGLIKGVPNSAGGYDFSKLVAEQGNRNSLRANCIKSLLIDPSDENLLWIGTNGMGMSRLNMKSGQFTHFSESGGTLPDDVVYGILPELSGKTVSQVPLWISTNKGLTRFSPATGLSQFFNQSDGLQDNEFNTYASFSSDKGMLFFGGVNGLTVFNPKDLSNKFSPPVLRFTELSMNGSPINAGDSSGILPTDISFADQLTLSHSQNTILIQFAAMDFTSPGRNQFAYYLEGAEKPWVHRGFDHSAQYLSLSPGTYIFKVKGTTNNGTWSEEPISLKIIIRAPWFQSWPAYLVYLIIFIISGYLFNQYQLTQRLKAAETKRLKNLDQFKTRFYTNITHEFRTPLTVILGMTEQLMSQYKGAIHPLTLIRRNGENLMRLVNQILDLTRLEHHELSMNYIQGDVLGYLRYISESLHSLANTRTVELSLSCSQPQIIMDYDPERLLQIVHNLLSNAIKFTPSGGKVDIRVELEDKILVIKVTDTGIGVPPEDLPKIFDRFFQTKQQVSPTDAPSRKLSVHAGSSGIGLSLTKELVQAMGGEISVYSPVPGRNDGTVFTVKLPVTNRAEITSPESVMFPASDSGEDRYSEQSSPETAFTVLLIEDNPDVMEYLASCLGGLYRLEFAFNGRSGIDKALEITPDLIVSDVMMPEVDGFEVCDFLKQDERTSHIPIVLLTAKVTMEDRIAGLKRGADAYLAKPFHEEELLVWVEQLIKRQHMLQSRYANLSVNASREPHNTPPENLIIEDSFVIRFRAMLDANYTDPELSVDMMSAKMGMSRTQLYRKLNSLTGKSVNAHLTTLRLGKAKELLQDGELNISEVAYEVGFNDPKYFGRLFADAFGIPPSEFASKH